MNPCLDDIYPAIVALPDNEAKALLDWLEDYVLGMEEEEDFGEESTQE